MNRGTICRERKHTLRRESTRKGRARALSRNNEGAYRGGEGGEEPDVLDPRDLS